MTRVSRCVQNPAKKCKNSVLSRGKKCSRFYGTKVSLKFIEKARKKVTRYYLPDFFTCPCFMFLGFSPSSCCTMSGKSTSHQAWLSLHHDHWQCHTPFDPSTPRRSAGNGRISRARWATMVFFDIREEHKAFQKYILMSDFTFQRSGEQDSGVFRLNNDDVSLSCSQLLPLL